MIYVSKTRMPDFGKYTKKIKKLWDTHWLTNDGEYVQELEKKLQKYWKVKHVVCVDHGTSAIMIATRALGVKDKIYTSPFSYVATVAAVDWMGIEPKFLDYGDKWKGPALATHVYGIPNMVDAKPVIYDASHAFAVKYKGKSILSYGDVSAISFHAVKIFQCVEGGAVVTNSDDIARKARLMRNFGLVDRYHVEGQGINCKMSEFHAAMGLLSLEMVDESVKRYQEITDMYNDALGYNYQGVTYYPIWYDSEKKLLKAIPEFEKNDIFPRRYFYPPLNTVYGGKHCPLEEDAMKRVLCLPLYYDLTNKEVEKIIKVAQKTL